jgi:hypothetical protein
VLRLVAAGRPMPRSAPNSTSVARLPALRHQHFAQARRHQPGAGRRPGRKRRPAGQPAALNPSPRESKPPPAQLLDECQIRAPAGQPHPQDSATGGESGRPRCTQPVTTWLSPFTPSCPSGLSAMRWPAPAGRPGAVARASLPRPGMHRANSRSHHSQKGSKPRLGRILIAASAAAALAVAGPHSRWLTARHPVTSRTWTRVRLSLVQRGPPRVQQPARQLPAGRHHSGRLRHRGVPDSLPSRQAGERGPGLHHTLALRLRHPVRPRSRPHPDQRQRRWNPPTTAWPGTRRASRGRTARLRRAPMTIPSSVPGRVPRPSGGSHGAAAVHNHIPLA